MIYDPQSKATYHALGRSSFRFSFANSTLSAANLLALCLPGPCPSIRTQQPQQLCGHLILLSLTRNSRVRRVREPGTMHFWLLSMEGCQLRASLGHRGQLLTLRKVTQQGGKGPTKTLAWHGASAHRWR